MFFLGVRTDLTDILKKSRVIYCAVVVQIVKRLKTNFLCAPVTSKAQRIAKKNGEKTK